MIPNDSLKKFAVIVNGGSGCIFQPQTKQYSYVLTAKHLVQTRDLISIQGILIEDEGIKLSKKTNCFQHPTKDAVIIKIPKVKVTDSLGRVKWDAHQNLTGNLLIGFPKERRGDEEQIRLDKIEVYNTRENNCIEAEIHNRPRYMEVKGMSGGGIIKKVDENYFLLTGIQSRMVAPDEKELLGRVEFMPLSFFDEIVSLNRQLASLIPSVPTEKVILIKLRQLFNRSNIRPFHCDAALSYLSILKELQPFYSTCNPIHMKKNKIDILVPKINSFRSISPEGAVPNDKLKIEIQKIISELL